MAASAAPTPESPDAGSALAERDLLRTIAAGTAGVLGEAFLRSLVHQLAIAFDADIAFLAERLIDRPDRCVVLASWSHGIPNLAEGHEFDVAGTPCELVGKLGHVAYPDDVGRRFPGDRFVERHGLAGYLAVALRGADGSLVGHIGVMSRRRFEASEAEVAAMDIFAARAAAEIERRRHEATLRQREAEIAASRTRIVQAADQERRRIGRDLHDGAQQRLVALGHLLHLAQRALERSPEEAVALLEQAAEQATVAGSELRDVARGLHPTALAERGLRPALSALGVASSVPVRIVDLPERRLPDAIEVTIYYLTCEALTNVVKYARATELRVEVTLHDRAIVVELADDGIGGAEAAGGSGLLGLTDRVATLGGRLEVHSPPGGGTRLHAWIPMAPWRTAREPFLEFGHPGDDGRGERMIGLVLAGRKTATVSLAREWELEGGPPRVGQHLPVMDHTGMRRGTVEIVSVASAPFGEIDDDAV